MSTKVKRLFLSWFLSVFLIISTVAGSYAFTNILAFGDSFSDNGGSLYGVPIYPDAVAYTNPNDIFGLQRFSNGPSWVEYMAKTNNKSQALLDNAWGGATTGLDNPAIGQQSQTGLLWQVGTYGGSLGMGTIAPDTLITVWAGANDMFNYSRGLNGTSLTAWADQNYHNGLYDADNAVTNIKTAILYLINKGGKTFVVPNLNANLITSNVNAQWIADFDAALFTQLGILNQTYAAQGIDIELLDMNTLNLDSIAIKIMPDGVHPTTAVQERIALQALSQVPEPASIIFLIIGFAGLAGARRIRQ